MLHRYEDSDMTMYVQSGTFAVRESSFDCMLLLRDAINDSHMGTHMIFPRRGQLVSRGPEGRGGVEFLGRGCEPLPPARGSGERKQIFAQFLTSRWPLAATIFATDLLCIC